jgi:hypothetical protein
MALLLFLKSMLKRWWALMSCAVFTGIGVYAAAESKSNTWIVWASSVAAIALFVVAAFLSWNEEHNARVQAETQLDDQRPRIMFGLLTAPDWTTLDVVGEYVFTLRNYGKRPATYVSVQPLVSSSGNFTIHFEELDVLPPNGHYRAIRHDVDDGQRRWVLDKRKLWEFFHNRPLEDPPIQKFDIVISFRDVVEHEPTTAQMEFDINTRKITILPH